MSAAEKALDSLLEVAEVVAGAGDKDMGDLLKVIRAVVLSELRAKDRQIDALSKRVVDGGIDRSARGDD